MTETAVTGKRLCLTSPQKCQSGGLTQIVPIKHAEAAFTGRKPSGELRCPLMHRFFLLLACLFTSSHAADRGLDGDYEIVTALEANPATRLAAKELRIWLKESVGVELPQATAPSKAKTHLFLEPNT